MRRHRRRELRPPIGSTELPSIQRLDTWILRYGPAGDTPSVPSAQAADMGLAARPGRKRPGRPRRLAGHRGSPASDRNRRLAARVGGGRDGGFPAMGDPCPASLRRRRIEVLTGQPGGALFTWPQGSFFSCHFHLLDHHVDVPGVARNPTCGRKTRSNEASAPGSKQNDSTNCAATLGEVDTDRYSLMPPTCTASPHRHPGVPRTQNSPSRTRAMPIRLTTAGLTGSLSGRTPSPRFSLRAATLSSPASFFAPSRAVRSPP